MRTLLISAVLAFFAAVSGVAIAAAPDSDPVIGTWKLNPAKSTFTSGPALKSQTRTYSQSGERISLVMKSMSADGKEATSRTTYQFDGKDYPVTGNPDFDSLTAEQVDANTAEFTLKKGGKTVGTTSRTVSKDGKTLTSEMKVTTANGEKSENVLVFDKQYTAALARLTRPDTDVVAPRYIPDLATGKPSQYVPREGQPPIEPGWKSNPAWQELVPPRKA